MEQQPRLLYRPSRPSPLASCSYNAHSSSPTAATPAFGWSSSSSNFGDMASSSSPTRSTYSFAYPDTLLSGREPDSPPWRSTPSSSTKRSLQYKSTTSIRTSSSTSHTNATTPPTPLASGTRWHDQFTQRCKQRAKQERSKAVNERRNGFAGDYVSLDRESKEELAVLRKLAMAEQQAMEEINNGHLTQQARDPRLYSEAEVHHNKLYAIDESALEDDSALQALQEEERDFEPSRSMDMELSETQRHQPGSSVPPPAQQDEGDGYDMYIFDEAFEGVADEGDVMHTE